MKYNFALPFSIFTAMIALGLAACSGGGGGANGGGSKPPQSKEEALQKISAHHRAHFAAWQNQVVKACDSSEAFGLSLGGQLEKKGLDGAALLNSNKGSMVFSDGNKFAILSGYNSFPGVGSSKAEETVNVNGQSSSISVETKREGSNCTVFLFGQKVYEAVIAESFIIGSQYSPDKEASATSQIPVVKNLGVNGAGEAIQHSLYFLLTQTLRPSQDAASIVGQKVGLNAEQAARLLKLSNQVFAVSAVRLAGEPSAVWSNAESGNLIAQAQLLRKAFDGNSKVLNFEVRLAIPEFEFKGRKNSTDLGNLKLAFSANIRKNENGFLYSTQGLENSGILPFNQAEAEHCANARVHAYLGAFTAENAIVPSTQVMFSACRTLYPDIEKLAYENGLLKSLIPVVFAGVTPSSQFAYGGWDVVLGQLAKTTILQNKNIVAELDPEGKTQIIKMVASNLETLLAQMENAKNMQLVKESVLQMGVSWSLKGAVVAPIRIAQIIKSVDNSLEVFRHSSERLLNDLARNPNSFDEQLSYAAGIDSVYKSQALQALHLAKSLDYNNFESDIFNQVLQKKVSFKELQSWSERFTSIQTEINKYPALAPLKGDLVGSSLNWLKNGELTNQDLAAVYAGLNTSIDPFADSTRKLVQDLGQALGAHQEGLEFARNLSTEYKQLALSIRAHATAADYESWGTGFFNSVLQKRPSLQQLREWNDLWVSANSFIQREKAKVADQLGASPEWNRKKVIESALKESWSGEDFLALESIAALAKWKNVCERYVDASSQADCVGMGLFSKTKGKFFDPSFANRYTRLSADLQTALSQLASFEWTTFRWELVGKFFDRGEPMWSKCDNNLFQQKSSTLKTQLSSLTTETDQLKKWELERQIKASIQNCP